MLARSKNCSFVHIGAHWNGVKGFGTKERGAGGYLHLAMALFLRNRVIVHFRHLLRKLGNALHIFHRLGRKSQHEVELYAVPAALERLGGTI